ncbi:MAG: Mur ligase family protein [Leptonema sp. (in: bacteria)]
MDLLNLVTLLNLRFPQHIKIYKFEENEVKQISLEELPKIEVELTDDSRQIRENSFYFSTYFSKPYLREAIQKNPIAIFLTKKELESISIPKSNTYFLVGKKKPDFYLGHCSSLFYEEPSKDQHIVAVTGTNGKTTTCFMIYHLWKKKQIASAVIGTLGVYYWDGKEENQIPTGFTTPRAYELQRILYFLRSKKIFFIVMEASSEALALKRLEGLYVQKAIFTNFSQDHLNFHKTMNHYFFAKLHLFFLTYRHSKEIFPFIVVYNHKTYRIFYRFSTLLNVTILYLLKSHLKYPFVKNISLNFEFNQWNALCAYFGSRTKDCKYSLNDSPLSDFMGVAGRMEKISWGKALDIFIDYAHTPDALKNVLEQLKKNYETILTVFGCGGDRDHEKRPIMGKISSLYSDYIFITDDNPRTEKPEEIRKSILMGIPEEKKNITFNIQNREEAIKTCLNKGKELYKESSKSIAILIAGKGHENYQIIEKEKIYFSDKEIVLNHIKDQKLK